MNVLALYEYWLHTTKMPLKVVLWHVIIGKRLVAFKAQQLSFNPSSMIIIIIIICYQSKFKKIESKKV